jgi:TolB protein
LRRITKSGDFKFAPAWSPDGKRIVFDSDRAGNSEIYVMHVDGSKVRRLTGDPADDGLPDWQPLRRP